MMMAGATAVPPAALKELSFNEYRDPNSTSPGPNSTSPGPNSTSPGPNSTSPGPNSTSPGPDSPMRCNSPIHGIGLTMLNLECDELIARVQVHDRIGGGTGGRVYKAALDGFPVALKVLHPQAAQRECNVQNFMKEAALMHKLRHRNVVQVFGVCHVPPSFCRLPTRRYTWGMLQELCDEGTLSQRLVQQAGMPEAQLYTDADALSWMAGLACALEHLHTQNPPVIHRDVKSENVLLAASQSFLESSGNGRLVVKLADFGTAVELDSTRPAMLRRRSSSVTSQDAMFFHMNMLPHHLQNNGGGTGGAGWTSPGGSSGRASVALPALHSGNLGSTLGSGGGAGSVLAAGSSVAGPSSGHALHHGPGSGSGQFLTAHPSSAFMRSSTRAESGDGSRFNPDAEALLSGLSRTRTTLSQAYISHDDSRAATCGAETDRTSSGSINTVARSSPGTLAGLAVAPISVLARRHRHSSVDGCGPLRGASAGSGSRGSPHSAFYTAPSSPATRAKSGDGGGFEAQPSTVARWSQQSNISSAAVAAAGGAAAAAAGLAASGGSSPSISRRVTPVHLSSGSTGGKHTSSGVEQSPPGMYKEFLALIDCNDTVSAEHVALLTASSALGETPASSSPALAAIVPPACRLHSSGSKENVGGGGGSSAWMAAAAHGSQANTLAQHGASSLGRIAATRTPPPTAAALSLLHSGQGGALTASQQQQVASAFAGVAATMAPWQQDGSVHSGHEAATSGTSEISRGSGQESPLCDAPRLSVYDASVSELSRLSGRESSAYGVTLDRSTRPSDSSSQRPSDSASRRQSDSASRRQSDSASRRRSETNSVTHDHASALAALVASHLAGGAHAAAMLQPVPPLQQPPGGIGSPGTPPNGGSGAGGIGSNSAATVVALHHAVRRLRPNPNSFSGPVPAVQKLHGAHGGSGDVLLMASPRRPSLELAKASGTPGGHRDLAMHTTGAMSGRHISSDPSTPQYAAQVATPQHRSTLHSPHSPHSPYSPSSSLAREGGGTAAVTSPPMAGLAVVPSPTSQAALDASRGSREGYGMSPRDSYCGSEVPSQHNGAYGWAACGDDESEPVYTLTGRAGTCLYMAPEIVREEPYNEKVDVFSFGIVMFEVFSRSLLAHSQPGRAELELLAQRMENGYRPKRPEGLDAQVWSLIQSCWKQDPIERPTMSNVARSLDAIAQPMLEHISGNLAMPCDPTTQAWPPSKCCQLDQLVAPPMGALRQPLATVNSVTLVDGLSGPLSGLGSAATGGGATPTAGGPQGGAPSECPAPQGCRCVVC